MKTNTQKIGLLSAALVMAIAAAAESCYTYVQSFSENKVCSSNPCRELLYSPGLQFCSSASSPTGYNGCTTNGNFEMVTTVYGGGNCVNLECNDANTFEGSVTNTQPNLQPIPCGGM